LVPVTRGHLERWIAELHRRFGIDVFQDVDDDFAADDAAREQTWLMWGHDVEAAIVAGPLARPIALRWRGDRSVLQTALAYVGLTGRFVTDEDDRRGALILGHDADEVTCDLRKICEVFAALRAQRIIALENPGWTQSLGWEAVAEHPRGRSAVFWHSQAHDAAFDEIGQLTASLLLHWRGELDVIAHAFEAAGFEVVRPASEDKVIEVNARVVKPPHVPSLADVPRAAKAVRVATPQRTGPLAALHRWRLERRPVMQLAWHAQAGLALSHHSDDEGAPTHALVTVSLETGAVQHSLTPPSRFASCGGCHWLDHERLLVSWHEQQSVVLEVWVPASGARLAIANEPVRAVEPLALSAIDANAKYAVMITQGGASLRETAARDGRPTAVVPKGVAVRRKAAARRPWEEQQRYFCEQEAAYATVALSPDGSRVFWTTDRGYAQCLDRATGEPRWRAYLREDHRGNFRASLAGFDPRSALLAVQVRRSTEIDGEWRDERTIQIYDAATGERRLPKIWTAAADAVTFAFRPDGTQLAIGTHDGWVALLSIPEGEVLAREQVFEHGRVTKMIYALGRIVVGSSVGHVAVLDAG
jgi:hypothetical protein